MASDFEQRRPLDGLHHSPEVAVVVAKVAIPPAARHASSFIGIGRSQLRCAAPTAPATRQMYRLAMRARGFPP